MANLDQKADKGDSENRQEDDDGKMDESKIEAESSLYFQVRKKDKTGHQILRSLFHIIFDLRPTF